MLAGAAQTCEHTTLPCYNTMQQPCDMLRISWAGFHPCLCKTDCKTPFMFLRRSCSCSYLSCIWRICLPSVLQKVAGVGAGMFGESMLHARPCCFFKHAIQSSQVCCMASSGHDCLHLHLCVHWSLCATCVCMCMCLEMCGQHCCCRFLLVLTTPYESFHCIYRLILHLEMCNVLVCSCCVHDLCEHR